MRVSTVLAACLTGLLWLPAAAANGEVEIREWEVPWARSRPRDPFNAPDGSIWFNGQARDYLARLDVESGEMTRIDLPQGSGPHNLIVDPDGIVWFAGNRRAYIGRLDPESGEIEQIAMPREDAIDPHTLVFGSCLSWRIIKDTKSGKFL